MRIIFINIVHNFIVLSVDPKNTTAKQHIFR